MMKGKNKKGQITIFVIIALLLVAGIILYFLLQRGPTITKVAFTDPQKFIDSCMKDSAQEALNIIMPQGGYLSPKNYKLYEDNKVAYLCYTSKYYEACTNQEPLYIKHLEEEIDSYVTPKVQECFFQLRQDLEKRNYAVDEKGLETSVALEPKKLKVVAKKYLKLSKGNEVQEFNEFSSTLSTPLYDLAIVAQEIASQEARFCDFEYLGYMILHKEFDIDKTAVGGAETASKIYIVGDRNSGKKLNIAIRSCAIPPGF